MGQKRWLIGQHLRSHSSNHCLGIGLKVLILISTHVSTTSAASTVSTTCSIIIIIWLSSITIIIVTAVATLALWLTTLVGSILVLASTVGVTILVILLLIRTLFSVLTLLGEIGGLACHRLKSRLRRRVGSRMNLPKVNRFGHGLACLLLITRIIHDLLPIDNTSFCRSIIACCCLICGNLRRRLLPRLIDGLALV